MTRPTGRPWLALAHRAKRPTSAELRRAESVFRRTYEQYLQRAVSFAQRYVVDEAEDVVQEAFIGLWQICSEETDVVAGPLDTLLFHILRRRIIDRLRAGKTESTLRDDADVADLDPPPRRELGLVADAGFLKDRIAYIVATLPPRTRAAYQLAERFDFDHHAVAREMGIEANTARWHLGQALEHLRAALRRDGYDLPDKPSIGRAQRRGGIES